jgi:hypothetical protein
MELSLGLGSGFDMYDKQRKDEKHEIDDGTQIMTVTVKGTVFETMSCEQSAIFFQILLKPIQNKKGQKNLRYPTKKAVFFLIKGLLFCRAPQIFLALLILKRH